MELLKKFQKLNLHADHHEKSDNEKIPFVASARLKEEERRSLYGCAFNQYLSRHDEQIVATVGSHYVHLYSVPLDVNVVKPIWGCDLASKEEDLYSVTWCFDTYEAKQGNNPYKLVTGGHCGQVYVIDAYKRNLCNRMQFAGGAINDLRTCPTNSNLVACGSKDSTIRIFHIRNQTCLITMGGLDGHVGEVLSVDWAGTGAYILSCGFDHQIMKWDLSTNLVKNHLETACKALESGEMNILDQETPMPEYETKSVEPETNKTLKKSSVKLENYQPNVEDRKIVKRITEELSKPPGCFLPIYVPQAKCSDLHVDYVDCVRTLGTSDYIFSKACGRESAICLWRFGGPKGCVEKETIPGVTVTTETRLSVVDVPNGEAWFTKFEIDPTRQWLACGGTKGTVNIFSLKKPGDKPVVSVCVSADTIRQVTFSAGGRVIIAVGESGLIVRFDRVPASADLKDFDKLVPLK